MARCDSSQTTARNESEKKVNNLIWRVSAAAVTIFLFSCSSLMLELAFNTEKKTHESPSRGWENKSSTELKRHWHMRQKQQSEWPIATIKVERNEMESIRLNAIKTVMVSLSLLFLQCWFLWFQPEHGRRSGKRSNSFANSAGHNQPGHEKNHSWKPFHSL